VLLERRPEAGLWGGLWGFPEAPGVDQAADWCTAHTGTAPAGVTVHPVLRHGFTHFDLDMTPVEVRLAAVPSRVLEDDRWLWYRPDAPAQVGLAAPVARLLKSLSP
jgi:A/G-specific adenine glycosylase